MRARMWVRLLASYLVVIAITMLVTYVTMRLLAPRLFDDRLHGPGTGAGKGSGGAGGPGLRDAFRSALNTALLIALGASALVAGLLAALASRHILRPVTAVRDATRRVAAGDYQVRVPAGSIPELAALATDVNTLAGELATTEQRRTRLLGDVAHEMRTPLTVLDGYVEGLIDGVFAADEQTLGALSDEVQRLHRLADDLASLSRAEEQRLELHFVETDLAALARAATERLAAQFSDAGIHLVVHADQVTYVAADPQRIEQVVTNLLGNSIAATPVGGTVTVDVQHQHDRAVLTVDDTGVGLAPEDCDRVFERFYRVSGQPHRGTGSGIGLTIARSIARGHGGDLTAASDGPGQGARFTLILPAGR